ncbi:hypothetical protein niasHS_001698 [Heterodera schachtii]|uniref:Uncharacterized protein n=1 Tax=Heterodera schachtii TaxID=97005 RepID=A0ABD2KBR9_HETSC
MADETESSPKDGGKNMQWMYEGAKSVVNREDYLLGKKIDKNFEMFSDVVVHDQEEEKRDAFFQQSLLKPSTSAHTAAPSAARSQHKVSALDTRVVRTEDPLVALKFQEEQRRRQLLENPLLKLKAQRVLRKAFEKELKKAVKKKSSSSKKKKRKRSSSPSSSSSSSSTSSPERRKEEEHQKRRHHHHHRRSEGRKSGDSEREGRPKRSSRSSSRTERHRRRRSSAGSSRRRRSRDRSRETTRDRNRDGESRARKNGSVSSMMAPPTATQPIVMPSKKLTAEELEERRRAMLTNASWRDEMRERNVRDAADKLRKEQDEMANHRGGAGFMRPMMNTATEDASIEKRLQSNRMNIQRQHDHMDKSFVRK